MPPQNLKRIKATLLTSGLQRTHPELYQTLNQIIDFSQDNIDSLGGRIISLTSPSGGDGTGFAGADKTYLTITDEHVGLPFSRRLLAGTNIAFDDTTPYIRTINATGGSSADYVVASDGATPIPAALDDGFGNFIYIPYTP